MAPGTRPRTAALNKQTRRQVEEGVMRFMRSCTVMLAIVGSAILAGSSLAQDRPPPSNRSVEPPTTTTTTGQAPRETQAPIGHRQPSAKDVPPAVSDPAPNAADRAIDQQLKICRGC